METLTGTTLDSGTVCRIVEDIDSDRILVTIRSAHDGPVVEYRLPRNQVAFARDAYDTQFPVDLCTTRSDKTLDPLENKEQEGARFLAWTPVESVVLRGPVVDVNLRAAIVGLFDRLTDKRGIHQTQKIINLPEALGLLSTNPDAEVEIVRIRVRGAKDTFKLRLYSLK